MAHLFTQGNFTLHSGAKSNWKIECDALTDEDWETLALMIGESYHFHSVYGIPMGGVRLAARLEKYRKKDGCYSLIVDDVLTTGRSMNEMMQKLFSEGHMNIKGVVVFSRTNKIPSWIDALFTYRAKDAS
jgi:orotate phosphoribosyltransferase